MSAQYGQDHVSPQDLQKLMYQLLRNAGIRLGYRPLSVRQKALNPANFQYPRMARELGVRVCERRCGPVAQC